MPWRQVRYLLDGEVQASDDATKILKLPLSNVIHSLFVKVECTNGATNNKDEDIDDVVDKIEVIGNGSEVLFSLTPVEIRRWALVDYGKPILEKVDEAGGATQWAIYPILFGFDEWDPNFWLPCAKFTDLELRIKYSPTISATKWATGTVTITVLAYMTMAGEPGPYKGTLRKTTVYDWTTAASGDKVIDLPRRLLYNRGLLYCYEAGIEDGVDITNIKFSLNNDERIPFNLKWIELANLNQLMYNLHPKRVLKLNRANNDDVYTKIARIQKVQILPFASADLTNDELYYAHADAIDGDKVTLECLVADLTAGSEDLTADTTDRDIYMEVEGLGIPHAVLLPFAELNGGVPFDPTKFDMVQLVCTQGGAGGDAKLSLEEILKIA